MSLHVFANIVTPFGAAANNRGENEGNTTTLQKLIWEGAPHTTVSAEAIRFSLRRLLDHETTGGANRTWNELTHRNDWKEPSFAKYADAKHVGYIDDDLLGFMSADAANEEAGEKKGKATVRRAVLEISRAVSLTPWHGDVVFNAASPRATASAAKGEGDNPVPYGAEIHATRYQFGFALTPERLLDKSRAAKALRAVGNLHTVAGNHGRFLFDFSPDAIVIRLTDDPAPRLLYCFETRDDGKSVVGTRLLKRIESKDVDATELIVGASETDSEFARSFLKAGLKVVGVKAAIAAACSQINTRLGVKE